MNEPETIRSILKGCKSIAVVGLSDKPFRDSFRVSLFMKERGYDIIPVNPNIDEWMGQKSYPDLKSIPEKVDLVDIFRRSEFVAPIVDEAIEIGAKAVWMQLGVADKAAAKKAEMAGLLVVMDKCLQIEHSRLFINSKP